MLDSMSPSTGDLHLARRGQVTCHNYKRLGYDRLTRGVYGHLPSTETVNKKERRRQIFLRRAEAIVAYYQNQVILCGSTALQVLGVALTSRTRRRNHSQ